jgi:hypothetical protein
VFAIFDLPLMALAVNWWLTRHTAPAAIGAGWMILPVALTGAVLAWVRYRREQERRAQDAERRTAQEI